MRLSGQVAVASLVTVLGAAGLGVWSFRAERRGSSAGLWFDDIGADASAEFAERAGSPLTTEEVARIESIAREELRAAYATTCLPISASPRATYRLHVQRELKGLIAAGSRSMPGAGGSGEISFGAIASNAVAFAPAGASREVLVAAIGRGIGRTAAHELAHQVLGGVDIHDKRDRFSYEYPDLRPEHFYSSLHWTIAAAPLQARLGRCP